MEPIRKAATRANVDNATEMSLSHPAPLSPVRHVHKAARVQVEPRKAAVCAAHDADSVPEISIAQIPKDIKRHPLRTFNQRTLRFTGGTESGCDTWRVTDSLSDHVV